MFFQVTAYWKSLNWKMGMKAVKNSAFLLVSSFGDVVGSSTNLLVYWLFLVQ